MGLLQKAYETYENHNELVGILKNGEKAPLLPVAHSIQKTQVEISISASGDFLGCCVVGKEDSDTVIPVTVESAGRSGKNPPPHPLSDKIQYLHPAEKEKYEAYVSLLSAWCESSHGHEKARAVLQYLKKETLLKDLDLSGIVKYKINNVDSESCLVRWCVKGAADLRPCWQDLELFKSWTDYYDTVREEDNQLLSVAHSTQKAQLEISLNKSGDFMDCRVVDTKDSAPVIPVPLEFAGKSGSNLLLYPFSDIIQRLHPGDEEKYKESIRLLSAWCESEYRHEKAGAVLQYLKKKTLLKDLESRGVLKYRINNIDFESCLVRWYVKGATDPKPCWQDLSLFKSWTDYYSAVLGGGGQSGGDICYITGRREQITTNHPKGIIKAANGAKLISANDSINFTYRGRFTDKDGNQASAVGYYASQKAHNALKWLIANQGFSIGRTSSRWYVCWNPEGKRLPQPDMSFLGFGTDDVEQDAVTPSNYKKQLRDAIKGYKKDLPESAEAIIASFDAATTGRLSLTYYNELQASDFLERVCDWYSSCCWYKRYGKEHYINSPSVYEIIASAYGTEQGGKESRLVPPDKLCGEQGQQLIKCIVERAAISRSLVQRLFTRANQRQAVSVKSYEAILFVACSIIRKYLNDKLSIRNEEEWTMALEPEKKDRSYQYGRLLAVMEKVERDTYPEGENREPNAIRLQAVFGERPLTSFGTIHQNLQPYFAALGKVRRDYYKRLIGEIVEIIQELPDGEQNIPLKETYLFGYYLQRQALYAKKEKSKELLVENNENDVEM